MQEIRANPKSSEYHISGWDKLGKPEAEFLVVVGLAAYVPDSALSLIFGDTRLALHAEAVREAMGSEVQWLETRGESLWRDLALAFQPAWEVTAFDLRARVLANAHIATGYFYMKSLAETEQFP